MAPEYWSSTNSQQCQRSGMVQTSWFSTLAIGGCIRGSYKRKYSWLRCYITNRFHSSWDEFCRWDYFHHDGKMVETMEMDLALEAAMKTWSSWIDQNVDTNKTVVFFRSISPEHKGTQWCYNETQPISDESDCSHWCLPGLPDTWNRLLYANIVSDSS